MAQVLVMETPLVTIWYHDNMKIVHHQFHKYIAGKDFQDALNTGYELLKKNGAKKWLSDDRKIPVLKKEDSDWAKSDWFPRVVNAGWKYWAIVLPEKTIGLMNLKDFAEEYAKAGITVNLFSEPEDALKWLEAQ